MKRLRTPWLALVALSVASCRTEAPRPSAGEPTRTTPTAAAPVVPASEPAQAVVAVPILPAGGASAAQSSSATVPVVGTRAERMTAIESEFAAAMDAYFEPFRQAKTDEERQKIAETTTEPDAAPYRARARALVEQNASDEVGFAALSFLIQQRAGEEEFDADIALLARHHFDTEQMGDAISMLQYSRRASGTALLARLAVESPHRTVRGRALMAQAEALKDELSMSTQLAGLEDEEQRRNYVEYVGRAEFDRLLALDRAKTEASVVQIYETVVRDYADVPAARSGVIGDSAKAALHELKNLVVGKVAPNITGEDIDGVAFQLADYRGKVVLLDFWGNW